MSQRGCQPVITTNKWSLQRLSFYMCLSFCPQGVLYQHALQMVSQHALQQVSRRGVVSQHALQVSRPTPRGEVEGDLARGVSRPTPGGGWLLQGGLLWEVCSQGGCLLQRGLLPRGCGDQTWWLLLQAVRILFESILVCPNFQRSYLLSWNKWILTFSCYIEYYKHHLHGVAADLVWLYQHKNYNKSLFIPWIQ